MLSCTTFSTNYASKYADVEEKPGFGSHQSRSFKVLQDTLDSGQGKLRTFSVLSNFTYVMWYSDRFLGRKVQWYCETFGVSVVIDHDIVMVCMHKTKFEVHVCKKQTLVIMTITSHGHIGVACVVAIHSCQWVDVVISVRLFFLFISYLLFKSFHCLAF